MSELDLSFSKNRRERELGKDKTRLGSASVIRADCCSFNTILDEYIDLTLPQLRYVLHALLRKLHGLRTSHSQVASE